MKACNFIKKRLQHSCFPFNNTNFEENLRTVVSATIEKMYQGFYYSIS